MIIMAFIYDIKKTIIMKYFFILPSILFVLFSCKENKKTEKKAEKKDHEKYINVFNYLKGQLAHIDTIPYGILNIRLKDTTTIDSVYINAKQLRTMVQPFLDAELEEDYFNEHYTQTAFGDATIGTVTVSYFSKVAKDPVQRIDIYANPTTGEINKVYILKNESENINSSQKQLLWTQNQGFSIIEAMLDDDGLESTITNKVILQ